jgi:cyclophilin family peptidyl-prolyl cis-trans isomerase
MRAILPSLTRVVHRLRSRFLPAANRPAPNRRRVALESLELRLALDGAAPSFLNIGDQAVAGGAPLWLGIDGSDPDGGPLTYTISVSNPALLQATISPTTNSSLQMDVAGYGQMTFHLFDHLTPKTTQHIKSLVSRGDFNNSADLPVKWYRISHYGDNTEFVIQAGPQYDGGLSSLGKFDDEYHLDLQYTSPGLLAMAKSTDDTNDAQIFVSSSPARFLDFNHAIFGVITEGEAVRQAIQRSRTSGDGPPPSDIIITSSTIVTDSENAALMLKAAEGASGQSDVTLTVTDAQGNTYSQTFHVIVTPDTANSAPFLANLPATITADSGQPVTIQLQALDAENSSSFFDAVKPPNETVPYTIHVNHDTGLVTITPPAGFNGRFQLQVGVRGATQATTADQFDTQLIEVVVGDTVPDPSNNPPIAVNDTAFATANLPPPGFFIINVLANDSTAPDVGETLTIVSVTQPASGGMAQIEFAGGTNIRYRPGPGFTGTDTFFYTISDGRGGTATATVNVIVHSPPTTDPQVALILELTTPDGSPLTHLVPGQEFVLHVLAHDQSVPPHGVFAAYLDVAWDGALAVVT